MIETWRPIIGFEGRYEVSDKARVRRCARHVERSNGHPYHVAEKMLAQVDHAHGYKLVGLKVAAKTNRVFLVHRLVAQALVSNPQAHPDVNHKDLDKTNNAPEHLEWCTKAYNSEHAAVGGRFHGRSNPNARFKLQPEQADDVLRLAATGVAQDTIAKRFGVSQSLISMIVCKHCWQEPPTEMRT